MKYLKRVIGEESRSTEQLLKKWELNVLLTLIILLVMATIVDLNLTFEQVLKMMVH